LKEKRDKTVEGLCCVKVGEDEREEREENYMTNIIYAHQR